MISPVTLSTAAAAASSNIWLTIRVGMVRRATGISVGDGGNEALIRRMRAQSNFIENAPSARAGNPFSSGAAAIFISGRVAHGIGMDGGPSGFSRGVGTSTTMSTQSCLAVWAVSIVSDA
ncbi:hypothetical protein OY671_008910 [Metschnikowia pulcherrima]|nr:hypothetical protein OY671_008910 [Metschnikowia pulcherrima]